MGKRGRKALPLKEKLTRKLKRLENEINEVKELLKKEESKSDAPVSNAPVIEYPE